MERFRLNGRLVDPSLNRVTTLDGGTVQVEPKIMQVLVTLAERPGEVVTRDDLMARVWNGVFVTDDALHRAIRELRRLFDDNAEAPRVIETIRKRGYRLIAPVGALEQSSVVSLQGGQSSGVRLQDGQSSAVRPRPANRRLQTVGETAAIVAVLLLGLSAVARFALTSRTAGSAGDPPRVTF